jgi:Tol biopolymer transport system component
MGRFANRIININLILVISALSTILGQTVVGRVTMPSGRRVAFDTHEGTFMNVDVAPNGTQIAFDLLGDLYTVSLAGGIAEPFVRERSWNRYPRYSPDGRQIAFISDRDGADNIWVFDISTRQARQVSHLRPLDWESAAGGVSWLADGRTIAFTVQSPQGSYVSLVSAEGGEARTIFDAKQSDSKATLEESERGGKHFREYLMTPTFSPEGERVFFSESLTDWKTVTATRLH